MMRNSYVIITYIIRNNYTNYIDFQRDGIKNKLCVIGVENSVPVGQKHSGSFASHLNYCCPLATCLVSCVTFNFRKKFT